jgi:hypothetical protein
MDERVETVVEHLLAGEQPPSIIRHARISWKLKKSQARKLISKARAAIVARAQERLRDLREWSLAARFELLAEAREAKDHRAALLILQDIAKLENLYERKPDLPEFDLSTPAGVLEMLASMIAARCDGRVGTKDVNGAMMLANIALKAIAAERFDAPLEDDDTRVLDLRKNLKLLSTDEIAKQLSELDA